MLQNAEFNAKVDSSNSTEPIASDLDRHSLLQQSNLHVVDEVSSADNLSDQVKNLQLSLSTLQRKVARQGPLHISNNGSEYEGSDELSPLHRKVIRPVAKRPHSAKVKSTNRPASANSKPLQALLQSNSNILLEALLSGQGCPGPAIQAEALELAQQGQLNCLLRLSVFIWPLWLDDRVGSFVNKLNSHSGIVLQMSHQEVIQQLNSLCQSQDSREHKSSGQNDATIHHMASVCVQRCSELLRSRDFQTTKQILQKTTQLTRRTASSGRTQLKLLPLKLIAAMLHVGDGNIRDAVFELRSAIECIPLEHTSVKPHITSDVALLYNHLSYYYSLLGSRVEAMRYTTMGIEAMSEFRSTMARSDMASHSVSVDEISARHQYIDAVLMMNQVLCEISNERPVTVADKALCSDAVMFLEAAGTSTACVSHLTDHLKPLFESIQGVLDAKQPENDALSLNQHRIIHGDRLSLSANQQPDKKTRTPHSKRNCMVLSSNQPANRSMRSSAKSTQSQYDVSASSASFAMLRSTSQNSSLKPCKTSFPSHFQDPLATRPHSCVRSKPMSPSNRNFHGNSKFKMIMLGPALAKGKQSYMKSSCAGSDDDEKPKLPESLIRALFPSSFSANKNQTFESNVSFVDAYSSDILNIDSSPKATRSTEFETNQGASLAVAAAVRQNYSLNSQHLTASGVYEFHRSAADDRVYDIDSLSRCCLLFKSFACSFDSCDDSSQKQLKLAAHYASKLDCESCYIFKLEGDSLESASATTALSTGNLISIRLSEGGICTTQMNRFLQNGVLMRPAAVLDEDAFTEAYDELDQTILPINADKCSILIGVVPGFSKLNNICGFLIAIRTPSAATFGSKELLVCEMLCSICSQSLPLL